MARITVAAPVTMSPPAHTPLLDVLPVSSSAIMYPHLLRAMSSVDWVRRGFAPEPTAITPRSHSSVNFEPSMGTGLRRPDSSGSPSSIFRHSIPTTRPWSSPRNCVGAARKKNSTPSSRKWPRRSPKKASNLKTTAKRLQVDAVQPARDSLLQAARAISSGVNWGAVSRA